MSSGRALALNVRALEKLEQEEAKTQSTWVQAPFPSGMGKANFQGLGAVTPN